MQIRQSDRADDAIVAFLQEHLDHMRAITPTRSVHALDPESLRVPGLTLWSAWDGDELLGCGALKQLDPSSGEIKSMRTAPEHRGKGIASAILRCIIDEAERRGYARLYLETGAMREFAPARALYSRHGFDIRGPFADYADDPNSVFMAKALPRP